MMIVANTPSLYFLPRSVLGITRITSFNTPHTAGKLGSLVYDKLKHRYYK